MNYLLNNLLQVITAAILLGLIAAPTGWLVLHLFIPRVPRFYFPVTVLIGMLVLPLFYAIIGFFVPLHMLARGILWVGLNGVLWTVPQIYSRGVTDIIQEFIPEQGWQKWGLLAIAMIALLITLFPLLLHDVPIEGRWYHVMAGDWVKHIGVGNALATDDHLPPADAFLSTELQMRYYYFAYVLPGMVARFPGITVTSSLTAFALWLAFGLPFLLYLYAREVHLSRTAALGVVFLITLVSSLDIFYVLDEHHRTGLWVEHIDFWANHDLRRINSISNMFIWTPQHVLGLAGFVVVLWLWQQREKVHPAVLIMVMAVIIASLSGISTFVWFGLMLGLGAYAAVEGLRRNLAVVWLIGTALLLSLLLALPYLSIVNQREEPAFAIQISATVPGLKYGGIFSDLFKPSQLTYALDFPLQMSIEFGLVMLTGLIGWWSLRKQWSSKPELRLWTVLLIIFFLIVLAVRPGRPDSNNYAARVAPMAWILLGMLSGYAYDPGITSWAIKSRFSSRMFALVGLALLIPGLASTFYEPWIEQGPNYQRLMGADSSLERHNFVTENQHEVYEWLNEHTQPDDVYQIGWESGKATYFVERRAAVAEGYLALLYVSDDVLFYIDALAALEQGFTSPDPEHAAFVLNHIHIAYIVTTPEVKIQSSADPHFSDYFELKFENADYQVYKVIYP